MFEVICKVLIQKTIAQRNYYSCRGLF